MPLTWQLCYQLIIKPKRSRALNLFAIIAFLGVTLSVALFVFVDALIVGLSTQVKQTYLGFESPLVIEYKVDQNSVVRDQLQSLQKIAVGKGMQSITVQQFEGLIQAPGQATFGGRIRAVDDLYFDIQKSFVTIYWFDGYNREQFKKSDDLIIVGEELYKQFVFLPGDTESVRVIHPFADLGPGGDIEPTERQFTIAGIFTTDRVTYDSSYAFVNTDAMHAMANPLFIQHRQNIYLADESLLSAVQRWWQDNVPSVAMKSWYEKNESLLKAMALEHLMHYFVLTFVIFIGSINLVALVYVLTLTKLRETSTLRTLGLTLWQIKTIFLQFGLVLGFVGAICGLALSTAVISLLQIAEIRLPQSYGFTELPLEINPTLLFLLLVATPLFCGLIALIPTRRLKRVSIIEGMGLS